ncbi:MAG: glycosyltransferase family 2 protein [Candidatus Omnitrophica bacterium]|nr:glycosyltransferase family 2 protein [Candidatus Omnitrophota bacterium]
MKIDLVIPVYNEEARLSNGMRTLDWFFSKTESWRPGIVIADNGSTDRTLALAEQWQQKLSNVRVVGLAEKGRGRALKTAWLESEADILAYMDVDISTDLAAFPALIGAVTAGEYDLAIGSRLAPKSTTCRSFKRELISRVYNGMVKLTFHNRFSDAQCGFKAISREAASRLLPLVKDPGWFFDTELLVLAEKLGYRIFDLPVRWVENRDSRVKIAQAALGQIRGMIRLKRDLARMKFTACDKSTHGPLPEARQNVKGCS